MPRFDSLIMAFKSSRITSLSILASWSPTKTECHKGDEEDTYASCSHHTMELHSREEIISLGIGEALQLASALDYAICIIELLLFCL